VPVIPIVGHGGHETTIVLSRGERIARALRLDRLRLQVYPILLQFPWGVSTPAFPSVPLPAKITMQVCDPIDWGALGPEAADDDTIVDRCYQQITSVMQGQLDELARANPRPLLGRLRRLLG
jgi:hypothetical protein